MKKTLILLILMATQQAFAAGGEGVPTGLVFWQAVNFSIFFGLLVYFTRGPIATHFKTQREQYESLLTKSQEARMAAEKAYKEVQTKLNDFKATEQKTLATAEADAKALGDKILAQAKEQAERMVLDAKNRIDNEVARAKQEIREELLEGSMQAAEKALAQKLGDKDHQRLQAEFADKVQVVQ